MTTTRNDMDKPQPMDLRELIRELSERHARAHQIYRVLQDIAGGSAAASLLAELAARESRLARHMSALADCAGGERRFRGLTSPSRDPLSEPVARSLTSNDAVRWAMKVEAYVIEPLLILERAAGCGRTVGTTGEVVIAAHRRELFALGEMAEFVRNPVAPARESLPTNRAVH